MEWQECPHRGTCGIRWIGLLECCTLIGKSTDTAIASKVVIERPVFLGQDDHMLDVSELRASGREGRDGRRIDRTAAAAGQGQTPELCKSRRGSELQ